MEIMKTLKEITMERNHVKISNKILHYIPKLLNVERVGAFFVDTANKNNIYNITGWDVGEHEIPYITNIAKYPSSIGLTGRAITTK